MPRYTHVHSGDKKDLRGAKKLFETPEALRAAAMDYIDWAIANPLIEEKHFCSQGQIITAEMAKPRAMSIVGLCLHMGISRCSWQVYRKAEEFDLVCEEIEDRMKQFKFENAVAGLMNPQMIMRDLEMVDKQELKHSSDGTMLPSRIELIAGKE
ncbi:hypothetical protein D3C77_268080 [compost metagenome]